MYQTHADLSGEEVSISVYDVDNQILSDSVHCHDRHEILLVTNGLGSWRMGELEGVFGPGFLSYIPAGALPAFHSNEGGAGGRVSLIALHFPREAMPEEL